MAKWSAEIREDGTVGILLQRAPGVVVGFPITPTDNALDLAAQLATALDTLEPGDDQ